MVKHTSKPKGSILAAVDIGSSKIAALVGRVIDDLGNVEILGVGHVAARGVKAGVISDMFAAEDSIRRAIHAAESMASKDMRGFPLRDVVLSVPMHYTRASVMPVDVALMGDDVTDSDIRKGLNRAQQLFRQNSANQNQRLVHVIPAAYQIDGHRGIEDPRGLKGHRLNIDVHMISCEDTALANLLRLINRNHLETETLCLPVYAAGLASLIDDELALGATVIDVGAGLTSYAIFRDGTAIHTGSVKIGGDHVTSDIAQGLNTSRAHAERIKILYGSVLSSGRGNEVIDVPQMGDEDNGSANHVPHAKLVAVMQPRLEELFEMVRASIDQSGLGALDGRRVVLTGGGSQTPGLRDLVGRILNRQVRLGRPIHVSGLPDVAAGPDFASAAGLLQYAAARMDERPHIPKTIDTLFSGKNIPQRIGAWLRENW